MKISRLIIRKLNGALSPDEEEMFWEWLNKSQSNKDLFDYLSQLKENGDDLSEIANLDSDKAWEKVQRRYLKRIQHQSIGFLKYAAAIVLILTIGYGIYVQTLESEIKNAVDYSGIILEMENGEIVILQDSIQNIANEDGVAIGKSVGNMLSYEKVVGSNEIKYNSITIPNGKTFEISLSDGTFVHLNAASKLRYPINFIQGKKREVFLEGEAFFEVAEDKNHPFVVNTSSMNIEVLGTQFNVSAYASEETTNAVLIEGSVSVNNIGDLTNKAEIILEPGHKAEWNFQKSTSFTVEEVDTETYTGWLSGKLVLKNLKFEDIIGKLERFYDVKINNEYEALNNETFTATFDIETISDVLQSFSENKSFKYSIKSKTITIKKP